MDRSKVSAIEIKDDGIALDVTVHGHRDPACRPTLDVETRFAVRGNRLVPDAGEAQKGIVDCAGYEDFFTHADEPMRIMAGLIRIGQTADGVMKILKAADRGRRKWKKG